MNRKSNKKAPGQPARSCNSLIPTPPRQKASKPLPTKFPSRLLVVHYEESFSLHTQSHLALSLPLGVAEGRRRLILWIGIREDETFPFKTLSSANNRKKGERRAENDKSMNNHISLQVKSMRWESTKSSTLRASFINSSSTSGTFNERGELCERNGLALTN